MELPTVQTVNTQTPRPQRVSNPDFIEVVGQPWITLQGEGPFAGRPAVFVRLSGCNLKCKACDTDYTTDTRMTTVKDLAALVKPMAANTTPKRKKLVVITGGEPFRQPISALLVALVGEGLHVQVETNGSLYPSDYPTWIEPMLHVVVSPKLEVNPDVWRIAKTAKYVLRHDRIAADGLPTGVLGYTVPPDRPPDGWPGQIYVQPEDDQDPEMNALNQATCVHSAMRFGYTVSLQLHKILGLP